MIDLGKMNQAHASVSLVTSSSMASSASSSVSHSIFIIRPCNRNKIRQSDCVFYSSHSLKCSHLVRFG